MSSFKHSHLDTEHEGHKNKDIPPLRPPKPRQVKLHQKGNNNWQPLIDIYIIANQFDILQAHALARTNATKLSLILSV